MPKTLLYILFILAYAVIGCAMGAGTCIILTLVPTLWHIFLFFVSLCVTVAFLACGALVLQSILNSMRDDIVNELDVALHVIERMLGGHDA